MSSILRALRKLEADSTREQDSSTIKTKQTASRKAGVSRDTYWLLSIILTVMLLAAAAWIILNSTKEPPETKTMEQSPPLKTESTKETQPSSDSSEQSPFKISTAAAGIERAAEGAQPEENQKPAEKTDTQKELSEQTEHPGRVAPATNDVTKPYSSQKKSSQENKIFKLGNTGFVLNGVLWSDKPGRRVAFINDQYLKEGDVINGATIIKIERRAVTLQSGEKKWVIRVKK